MIRWMSFRRGIRRVPSGRGSPRTGSASRAVRAPPRGGTAPRTPGRRRSAAPPACRRSGSSASARRGPGRSPSRDRRLRARPAERVDREPVVVAGDLDDAGRRFFTGWFTPRWPNFILNVRPPSASPSSWCPRQIPKIGTLPEQARERPRSRTRWRPDRPVRSTGTRRRTRRPAISAGGVSAGNTVASIPSPRAAAGCCASCRSRRPPRGTRRRASPPPVRPGPRPRTARSADTVLARSAPSIVGDARTRSTSDAASRSVVEIAAPHRALLAEPQRQPAGVDPLDADDVRGPASSSCQRAVGPPARRPPRRLPDDEARDLDPGRLGVVAVHAVVALAAAPSSRRSAPRTTGRSAPPGSRTSRC